MTISDELSRELPSSQVKQFSSGLKRRFLTLLGISTALITICVSSANAAELTNGSFRIELGTSASGLPIITQGTWVETNAPAFTDAGDAFDLSSWLPEELIPSGDVKVKTDPWKVTEDDSFVVGQACESLANGIRITWVVELSKFSSMFRLHVRLTNRGQMSQAVDWFPSWGATWQIPDGADWVRSWPALSYNRI